jgi:hypothetical protein
MERVLKRNPDFIFPAEVAAPLHDAAYDSDYKTLLQKCKEGMVYENQLDGLKAAKDQNLHNFKLPTLATTTTINDRLETIMLLLFGENVQNPDLLLLLGLNVTTMNMTLCDRLHQRMFKKNEAYTKTPPEFKEYVQKLAKHKFAAEKRAYISKVQEACDDRTFTLFTHALLVAFPHVFKNSKKSSFEPVRPEFCPEYLKLVDVDTLQIPQSPNTNRMSTHVSDSAVGPSPSGTRMTAAKALIGLSEMNESIADTRDELVDIGFSVLPTLLTAEETEVGTDSSITAASVNHAADDGAQPEDERGDDKSTPNLHILPTVEQEPGVIGQRLSTEFSGSKNDCDGVNVYNNKKTHFREEARAIGASKWKVPIGWVPIWCERIKKTIFFNETTGTGQVIFPCLKYIFLIF